MQCVNMNFTHHLSVSNFFVFYLVGAFFSKFLLWKTCLIFCLCFYLLCRRRNNHFNVSISDGLDPSFFPSNDRKDAVHGGKNGRRGAYFPPELSILLYK